MAGPPRAVWRRTPTRWPARERMSSVQRWTYAGRHCILRRTVPRPRDGGRPPGRSTAAAGSLQPAAALTEQHHAQRSAVPAERVLEPGEDLLLARQREPGAAGRGAQLPDLVGDGEPALDELDDLGVAGVDRGAQLADAGGGVRGGVGGDIGGGGAHRDGSLRGGLAVGPRERET